ncbi:Isochorismatase hydrolase [Daldinia caldariorum]|uniref:Isochorismatase hydrolase n=1 Tax=Daldinia caldariorum TaxID=326644 RepID=UPI00200750B5|nr:Isochorismatase hydrolase [Daldinia caldariorum]KAI1463137.1 Isochorismatase hydrolase [Daldinia caldariorum]
MSRVVALGPKGNEWSYDKDARAYDLTRGASPLAFTLRTTKGPTDTSITLAPSLSALVVVDMQNFFLHPSCSNHPTGLVAAERTLELIKKCREVGIKIIWLNWGLNDGDLENMPAATERSFNKSLVATPLDDRRTRVGFDSDLGEGRGRLLMEESWNAALYGALHDAASDSDTFCSKNRMSGFWHSETPLAKALVSGGFRSLLFAGVNTDRCVLGTLVDAYNRGYDCIMVEDCCATTTPGGQEVTIYNTAEIYGFVIDSKSVITGMLSTEAHI